MHEHASTLDAVHIGLALIIMAAYVAIPFTALRRIPLPMNAKVAGSLFFITCAITHLGIAAGFHNNPWMVLNDFVQAVSSASFIFILSRMVSHVLNRRRPTSTEG